MPLTEKFDNCLNCNSNLGIEYQEIFDDTGLELDLQSLLVQYNDLYIKQDKNKIQALCYKCLNQLIDNIDQQLLKNSFDEEHLIIEEERKKEEDQNSFDFEILKNENSDNDDDDVLNNPDLKSIEISPKSIKYDSNLKLEENDKEEVASNISEQFENVDYLDEIIDENLDFREYKQSVIRSDFKDIGFPDSIQCRICAQELTGHSQILQHTKENHHFENFPYPCIIKDECEIQNSTIDLSFHLVFKHYDLENLLIYAQCPECGKRFNDFISYNKHSCSRLSNVSRSAIECETCGKIFKSNKRYRFHLQFHLEKHRPKACLICDKIFRDEDEFFEHIKYGHGKATGYTCTFCDRECTSEESLKSHRIVHQAQRPYRCHICTKSYVYNQLLKDHLLTQHGNKSPFKCHICGKILFKKSLLKNHLMLHEKPKNIEITVCNLCGYVGSNQNETEAHIEKDHSINENILNTVLNKKSIQIVFICEYCDFAYDSIEHLNDHRNLSHTKVKKFQCTMCPISYDQFKKLQTHKLTHRKYVDIRQTFPVTRHYACDVKECSAHYMQWTTLKLHKRNKHSTQNNYNCSKCSKECYNSDAYRAHILQSHKSTGYECQFCNKFFKSKMAVSVHVSRTHNIKKFRCDECVWWYESEDKLKKHKKTVHVSFECNLCNKMLKNAKSYEIHKKTVHNKEKRYFCKYCNKGYFNNCDCIEHEQAVHEKIKKFQCELCSYASGFKESYIVHMRRHNNEMPFVCQICSKGFCRRYSLELHRRRHNNTKDFVCPHKDCESSFPTQGILNSHIKRKHCDNGIATSSRKRLVPHSRRAQEASNSRKYNVPRSEIFVDDDDGLEDCSMAAGAKTPFATTDTGSTRITAATKTTMKSEEQNINLILGNEHNKVNYNVENNSTKDFECIEYNFSIKDDDQIKDSILFEHKEDNDHNYIMQQNEIYDSVIQEFEICNGTE